MNIQRLPGEGDYRAATEIVDDQFREAGGPWVAAYGAEVRSHNDQALHASFRSSLYFARDVEPLDSDDKPLDELNRPTHAFKHGMMTGYELVEHVHDGLIDSRGVLGALHRATAGDGISHYRKAERMVSMGDKGLANIGDAARERIDAWGEDIVSDARAQRMYALGCGVVLLTAYSIHYSYNERILKEMADRIDWSALETPESNPGNLQ